ncbi:PREDICTED: JINGUBANG [Prunus dulcis]|uniref:PREDICTED: JINGUBANG n=1 Tax=Prunus dulcis TaxID=3755 RepID=A0A5E4EMQ5_PRUDU|nr:protein JINGUBANG [Prunus dulcis]VVA16967.1 PREDICTED: JINGUBANG [Prunus dulcis]
MECHQSYQYYSSSDLHDQKDLSYISSQPSLQSVPSLASQSHNQSNPCHHCLTTLQGQNSYTSSLTLAGNFIYTGSSDGEIRSWRCNSLREVDSENPTLDHNMVAAGKGAVKSLAISGDKLFSAHQDHKIRVWKINTHHEQDRQKCSRLATLPTLGDRAAKLLMPNNHVQIRRHKKCTWVHHVDTVSALALSSDEQLLYSVSWDRTLKVWSTTDFKCLESVRNAHDDAINAVTSSNDGDIYTGSADKRIKVWRKDLGEKKHSLVATLEKHNSGVNALALSRDGCVLFSGACDRSIVVWEKKEGEAHMEVVGALRGHTKSILCLAVVSDLVCSGSADKSIRIWRGVDRSYTCLAVLEGHNGPVKCLTATVDDDHCSSSNMSCIIYSGSLDCDIKIWQVFVPSI